MRLNWLRLRAVAAVAVSVLGLVWLARPAGATVNAVGAPSTSVSSARWAVVATSTLPAADATGPLSITVGLLSPPQYFWMTNTGTISLPSASYTVAYGVTATGLGLGTLQLRACVGAGASWNETTNICVGGTAQTLSTSATAPGGGAIAVPTAIGSSLRLQLNPVGLSVVVNASIGVTVKSV